MAVWNNGKKCGVVLSFDFDAESMWIAVVEKVQHNHQIRPLPIHLESAQLHPV